MSPDILGPYPGGTVKVYLDKSQVEYLNGTEAGLRPFRDFLSTGTLAIALQIRDIARSRVSVQGKNKIGATGQSERNIFAKADGEYDAVVYEGSYEGNLAIRLGRKPGTSAENAPPLGAIKKWMASKPGMNWSLPSQYKSGWRMTKKGGPRARGGPGFEEPRPFLRDLKLLSGMLSRKILSKGAVKFQKLYPSSSPGYQYYNEMFDRTPGMKAFLRTIDRAYDNFFDMYANYIKDGHVVKTKEKEFFVSRGAGG